MNPITKAVNYMPSVYCGLGSDSESEPQVVVKILTCGYAVKLSTVSLRLLNCLYDKSHKIMNQNL